jgi:hypothetical protein
MQLVVFQLISGVMADVIRLLFRPVVKAWSEAEITNQDEFLLSPEAVKGQNKGR